MDSAQTAVDLDFLYQFHQPNHSISKCSAKINLTGNISLPINLLRIKLDNYVLGLSGGRIGYLPAFTNYEILNLDSAQIKKSLLRFMAKEGFDLLTITWPDDEYSNLIFDATKNIQYEIANIKEVYNQDDDTIGNSGNRNEIRRMVKKAKVNEISINMQPSERLFKDWYENCYLPRMGEVSGKAWSYSEFLLVKKINGKFVAACRGTEVVGGLLYIENSKTIEVLAVASTKFWLNRGCNYLLIHELFKQSYYQGMTFFNWQGSNPPHGPVAHFKKQWGTRSFSFLQASIVYDNEIIRKIPDFRKQLPNIFVFPASLSSDCGNNSIIK